jgi:hypothetical protein
LARASVASTGLVVVVSSVLSCKGGLYSSGVVTLGPVDGVDQGEAEGEDNKGALALCRPLAAKRDTK